MATNKKAQSKARSNYKKQKKSYVAIDKSTIEHLSDFTSFQSHFGTHPTKEDMKKSILFEIGEISIIDIANSSEPEKLSKLFDELRSAIESVDAYSTNFSREVLSEIGKFTNNAESGLALAKNDIMEVWSVAFSSDYKRQYNPPKWIKEPLYAEKFAPFMEKGERYIYTGFKNQMVINGAAHNKNESSIIVTKSDIEKLVNQDFVPDENSDKSIDEQMKSNFFAAMKGRNSVCSIFVPNIKTYYFSADGNRWVSNDGKRQKPTEQEIKDQHIRTYDNITYLSTPAWSISQFQDVISEATLAKYRELSEVRQPGLTEFQKTINKESELVSIIQSKIDKALKDHSLVHEPSTRHNMFLPRLDRIAVMEIERFRNPVLHYGTFMHELAHSTMHLLDRKILLKSDENLDFHYAIEEIIAETTSFLSVKQLESQLIEHYGQLPQEWDDYFEQASKGSTNYIASYSEDAKFKGAIQQIFDNSDGEMERRITEISKSILQAQQVLFNGNLFGKEITPELRATKIHENMKRWVKTKDKNKESTLEI
ncbi:hypothetical protein D051_1084 [Vibrio parahaemolyticus VPCR-2010]|uniref:zincin-like metallopeptidase domain-containing protein n=1 Tax=Vibrio parahaemolyticus TaxID=670 RepID=UPI00038E5A79|nr:hypothetical protein D051_1084 [Vibrio parahaemolyticus VPCR-2010]